MEEKGEKKMYRHVHPVAGELNFLRMLLNVVKGAASYEYIRTIDGVTYQTFQETCKVLGLLENDREWHDALIQASQWASSQQLR